MRRYTQKEIDFIKQNPQMTIRELAEALNIDTERVRRMCALFKLPYKRVALTRRLDLTIRETEVMEMLVKGFRCAYIADLLGVDITTVKTHVSNIRTKLLIDYDKSKHNPLTYTVYKYLKGKIE